MSTSRFALSFASIILAGTLAATLAGGCAAANTSSSVARPAIPGAAEPDADRATARALDRAALRKKLAERRQLTFQRFVAYRDAQVYPINSYGPGLRHVWIDETGNLCAAATLISGDWGRDAAARVGAQNRELRIADVTSGPVADWIATSGLTHGELVAIQLPGDDINDGPRPIEVQRMHTMYIDVERQLRSLWDENLDLAVDALLKRPALARAFLRGQAGGPGPYATPLKA
jgi:hypothetical protein